MVYNLLKNRGQGPVNVIKTLVGDPDAMLKKHNQTWASNRRRPNNDVVQTSLSYPARANRVVHTLPDQIPSNVDISTEVNRLDDLFPGFDYTATTESAARYRRAQTAVPALAPAATTFNNTSISAYTTGPPFPANYTPHPLHSTQDLQHRTQVDPGASWTMGPTPNGLTGTRPATSQLSNGSTYFPNSGDAFGYDASYSMMDGSGVAQDYDNTQFGPINDGQYAYSAYGHQSLSAQPVGSVDIFAGIPGHENNPDDEHLPEETTKRRRIT